MTKKDITLFEAASLITGLGVGGGIMAVPYLANQNGILPALTLLLFGFAISLLLHFMIAELALNSSGEQQLLEMLHHRVFGKRFGSLLTWIFFVVLASGIYFLLAGYIIGCAEILLDLTGLPLAAGELLTYTVAAGVVFFGLKAIGVLEKYAIIGIALLLLILSAGTLGKAFNPLPLFSGGTREALALFGMILFSFGAWFSIPQAVEGLSERPRLVPWAILIGLSMNFLFILIITSMSLLVSDSVTPIAISGWSKAVGHWAHVLGSLCVLLAMLTSYWAFSYALAVIIVERTGLGFKPSWLISTLPTLLLALSGLTGFLGFLRITGGITAVVIAILIVPALRAVRSSAAGELNFSIGRWGATPFQLIIVIAYLLMAVGSSIHID